MRKVRERLGDDVDFGRPQRPESIPLALLHEVFGQFMEDVKTCVPNATDNQFARSLRERMTQVRPTEFERTWTFRALWGGYLDAPLESNKIQDVVYCTNSRLRIGPFSGVVTEGKGEIYGVATDPLVQAGMHYLQALEPVKHLNDRFPCLIIYYAGM
jgi:hypothetical protein